MSAKPTGSTLKAARRRRLGIVFLTLFLDLVGFSLIFPLFPAILDHYLPNSPNDGGRLGQLITPLFQWAESRGASDPEFMVSVLFGGLLGSLYSFLQFLCAPLWGAFSDRVGRRKVLLITIAGLALSYAVWFFAASFWVFVLARMLGGIMGGNLSVITAAVADVTTKKERSGGMAVIGIAFGLGFIVGPAIGGLASIIDLTEMAPGLTGIGVNPFSVPAAISFVLALFNWIWIHYAFEETLLTTSGNEETTEPPGGPSQSRIPFLHLFRSPNPAIRRTNWIYLVFMLAFSGMEFTLTFLAVERFAFTSSQNGLMFVFIGFVIILTQGCIVRRMSGKGYEKILSIIGLVTGAFAFLLLAKSFWIGFFFGALALMAFSVALVSSTLSALVSLYSNEREQGQALGIFRSVGSLARAIGPLIAASVYFSYGSNSAYLLGAAIIVLPIILSLRLSGIRNNTTR